MPVTQAQPVKVAARTWRLSWSSDLGGTPTYYVYEASELIAITTDAQYVAYNASELQPPVIEVYDDADTVPAMMQRPGRLRLQWYGDAGDALYYRVEELIGSTWTTRQHIAESGDGYYTYLTRHLEDVTTHQFRVVPIDDELNDGTALTFTALVVRQPDPPEIASQSYDGGAEVLTVTMA